MVKGNIVEIKIWDDTLGYSTWDENRQCAVFQYAPEFVEKGYDVSPLTMPLTKKQYRFDTLNRDTFQGLPGLLSDSLPDGFGNALIDLWIRDRGIKASDFTPLDKLCYVGKRGMGALEYEPSVERMKTDEKLDADMLASLASDVMEERESFSADLTEKGIQELISIGTSAGGSRAKAVVALNESTEEIRSGQLTLPDGFSYGIIKFDTEQSEKKGYCRIEYAYHRMAADCGIDMTECRLLDTGKRMHFMTKRFDREGAERIHSQTLCALAHYDFRTPGRYSYEDVMRIMRKLRMPYIDQEQFFRRTVFNVILRNQDDHIKNISFIMKKDKKWRLAPAYDLTFAFDPGNFWMQRHQMSVNGKLQDIGRKDLTDLAFNMGIRDPDDIIDRTLSVASRWNAYAKEAGVPERTKDAIEDKIFLRI